MLKDDDLLGFLLMAANARSGSFQPSAALGATRGRRVPTTGLTDDHPLVNDSDDEIEEIPDDSDAEEEQQIEDEENNEYQAFLQNMASGIPNSFVPLCSVLTCDGSQRIPRGRGR